MAALLTGETFDSFVLSRAQITTFCTFTVEGMYHGAFDEDEADAVTKDLRDSSGCVPWGRVKGHVMNLIRGHRPPLSMQIMLMAPDELRSRILEGSTADPADIASLSLGIRFRDGELTLVTGTGTRTFIADRSYEPLWDSYVRSFLDAAGIETQDL